MRDNPEGSERRGMFACMRNYKTETRLSRLYIPPLAVAVPQPYLRHFSCRLLQSA